MIRVYLDSNGFIIIKSAGFNYPALIFKTIIFQAQAYESYKSVHLH